MLFNGKRVYKNAFYIKVTFMIRSQPFLSHEMREKVSVFLFLILEWRMA